MEKAKPDVYAVKHKDEIIREASRSGGIFTAVSDWVLTKNGVVYGCVMEDAFTAIHIRATTKEERNQMRGSKYIQSKLGDTFLNVQNDLKAGRMVLFSGTGCQVAGLRQFLGIEYENLICVDIVCHGVPSGKVWMKYLKWQESKAKSRIKTVDFRNKRDFGWAAHVETMIFDNGKVISSEVFKNLFYGHNVLRPSCYECPYKSIYRGGDISIADYWRLEKAAPNFAMDDKGVSLVLVNTELGRYIFSQVQECLDWRKTRIEDSMQVPLKESFPRPSTREQFWKNLEEKPFEYVAKKYANYGWENKVAHMLVRVKRKIRRVIGKESVKK